MQEGIKALTPDEIKDLKQEAQGLICDIKSSKPSNTYGLIDKRGAFFRLLELQKIAIDNGVDIIGNLKVSINSLRKIVREYIEFALESAYDDTNITQLQRELNTIF